MNADPHDLFSHDGHLSMLSLDRFDAGDLSVDLTDAVVDHLRACSVCSTRLEQIQLEPAFLPPSTFMAAHRRSGTAAGGLAVAATMAAAAALLLLVWPQPEQASRAPATEGVLTASPYTTTTAELDGLEVASEEFELRAFSGPSERRLTAHDRVAPEDEILLEVTPVRSGYQAVMVVGETTEYEDAEGTGGFVEPSEVRVVFPMTEVSPKSGPTTVRYQAEPSGYGTRFEERLVVIQCEEPFGFDASEGALDPELIYGLDGCTVRELPLVFASDVADS